MAEPAWPAPNFAIGLISPDPISPDLPMNQTINTAFLLDGILWSKKLSEWHNNRPNTSAERGDGAQAPSLRRAP
jgi:hypothetical protein